MFKNIRELFVPEKVNTGRQVELDMVKGLAIIFMVWCHVYEELGGNVDTPDGMLVDIILGGPFAAPVFMICMGIGICYSRKQDAKDLAQRGINLLCMGYLLNIFRYVIPRYLTYMMTKDASHIEDLLYKALEVDILQFAGLSFLALAVVKRLGLTMKLTVGIGIILSIIGCLLKDVATNIVVVDLILGLFWKTQEYTFFPFFHWFLFPVIGFILGDLLQHCMDKYKVYKRICPSFFILSVVAGIIGYELNFGFESDLTEYYYLTLYSIFFLSMFVISWIGMNALFHRKYPNLRLTWLQMFSKNINTIYCVHWILIAVFNMIRAFTWQNQTIGFFSILFLTVTIIIVSGIISHLYISKISLKNILIRTTT